MFMYMVDKLKGLIWTAIDFNVYHGQIFNSILDQKKKIEENRKTNFHDVDIAPWKNPPWTNSWKHFQHNFQTQHILRQGKKAMRKKKDWNRLEDTCLESPSWSRWPSNAVGNYKVRAIVECNPAIIRWSNYHKKGSNFTQYPLFFPRAVLSVRGPRLLLVDAGQVARGRQWHPRVERRSTFTISQ